jgi:hypothetical protein
MTADRCKETTITTGVGNITLLGAVPQFQGFIDAFSIPSTVSYAIVGQTGTEWEVGIGTYSAPFTLERTTVQDSSNAGAAVAFSAGTKDVFATLTAQDLADITTALAGKAATSHAHAGEDITSGTVADARLSSNVALENVANNFTAAQTVSTNGALSAPAFSLTGTPITGGTATTNKPLFLIEPTGTTSTTWNTTGCAIGANLASGYIGDLIDVKVNDSTTNRFRVGSNSSVYAQNMLFLTNTGGVYLGSSADVFLGREAANILQLGADAASPAAQTLKGPDARAGTDTNTAGGAMSIAAGRGTGTAAGGTLNLQTSAPTTSGTGGGTLTTRVAISDTAITETLPVVNSTNGAASTSPLTLSGSWFTGGTGTTTFPALNISASGATAPTTLSTSGTGLLLNGPSGFAGDFVSMRKNGAAPVFRVDSGGSVYASGSILASAVYFDSGFASLLSIESNHVFQFGPDSGTPPAQIIKGPDATAGSFTNTAGGNLTIAAGRGTGTAAGGVLNLQTSEPTASGTAAGTLTTRLAISGTAITASKPVILQAYTVATLPAGTVGMTAYVTDATAPTYLGALTGGGAVTCPVFYNGSAWVSH